MLPSLQNETNGSCSNLPVVGINSSPCNRLDVDTLQAASCSLFSSKRSKNIMRQQDNVVVKQSVPVVAVNTPRKEQRMQSLYDILCRAEQIMAEDSPSDLDLSEFFAELEASAAHPPSLSRFESVDSFDSVKFYRRRSAKKGATKKDMK
jgi:hypothetical protein